MILNAALPRLHEGDYLNADKISLRRLKPSEDSLHGHDFFELVYVVKGTASHQLGAHTHRLEAGDYFIMDLGSFHCYRENRDFTIVNCLFAPEYVDRAMMNCPSLSALLSNKMRQFGAQPGMFNAADRIYRDETGYIRSLVESMESEYARKETGYLEMVRCRLIEILVRTARTAADGEGVARSHPAVAAMAEYLNANYAQPLFLADMSAKLGYTPQYLSYLFHRETGVSLSGYLQRLRVEKSCTLLSQTRLSVSAIAQMVGYSDLKHFNYVFRKHMDASPREFRARIGAGR